MSFVERKNNLFLMCAKAEKIFHMKNFCVFCFFEMPMKHTNPFWARSSSHLCIQINLFQMKNELVEENVCVCECMCLCVFEFERERECLMARDVVFIAGPGWYIKWNCGNDIMMIFLLQCSCVCVCVWVRERAIVVPVIYAGAYIIHMGAISPDILLAFLRILQLNKPKSVKYVALISFSFSPCFQPWAMFLVLPLSSLWPQWVQHYSRFFVVFFFFKFLSAPATLNWLHLTRGSTNFHPVSSLCVMCGIIYV